MQQGKEKEKNQGENGVKPYSHDDFIVNKKGELETIESWSKRNDMRLDDCSKTTAEIMMMILP
jgi:hypothetical protein